jgi:hypothetical protein
MGADGGIVLIKLKNKTNENYSRVSKLIKPFWQFTNRGGGYYIAEEANFAWENENHCGPPDYLIGCYGTDRGDSLNLGDLREILLSYEDEDEDETYKLTFDELDLDCRTSPNFYLDGYQNPLYKLWDRHFSYLSREDVLKELGEISNFVIHNWISELKELLNINSLCYIQTWT